MCGRLLMEMLFNGKLGIVKLLRRADMELVLYMLEF